MTDCHGQLSTPVLGMWYMNRRYRNKFIIILIINNVIVAISIVVVIVDVVVVVVVVGVSGCRRGEGASTSAGGLFRTARPALESTRHSTLTCGSKEL